MNTRLNGAFLQVFLPLLAPALVCWDSPSPKQEPAPAAGIEQIDGSRFSNVTSIRCDTNANAKGSVIIEGQVYPPDERVASETAALATKLRESIKKIDSRLKKGGLNEEEKAQAEREIRVLNLQLAFEIKYKPSRLDCVSAVVVRGENQRHTGGRIFGISDSGKIDTVTSWISAIRVLKNGQREYSVTVPRTIGPGKYTLFLTPGDALSVPGAFICAGTDSVNLEIK